MIVCGRRNGTTVKGGWCVACNRRLRRTAHCRTPAFAPLDRVARDAHLVCVIDPRAVTLSLLACRAPGATICPSEVARVVAADWRGAMPAVHAAIDGLVRDGRVQLSWKGHALNARAGPYRIAATRDD